MNDGSLETYKTLCQIDIKLSALLWISLWCAMVITLLLVGMAAITHRIDHLEQPPPVKTQPQEN